MRLACWTVELSRKGQQHGHRDEAKMAHSHELRTRGLCFKTLSRSPCPIPRRWRKKHASHFIATVHAGTSKRRLRPSLAGTSKLASRHHVSPLQSPQAFASHRRRLPRCAACRRVGGGCISAVPQTRRTPHGWAAPVVR
jgi:hypothetical protein